MKKIPAAPHYLKFLRSVPSSSAIVLDAVTAQRLGIRLVTERLWVRIRPGAELFFLLSPPSNMKGVLNQVPLRDPTLQIIL